jgi:hypothetical protein
MQENYQENLTIVISFSTTFWLLINMLLEKFQEGKFLQYFD